MKSHDSRNKSNPTHGTRRLQVRGMIIILLRCATAAAQSYDRVRVRTRVVDFKSQTNIIIHNDILTKLWKK